jgi:hypothetical protein
VPSDWTEDRRKRWFASAARAYHAAPIVGNLLDTHLVVRRPHG